MKKMLFFLCLTVASCGNASDQDNDNFDVYTDRIAAAVENVSELVIEISESNNDVYEERLSSSNQSYSYDDFTYTLSSNDQNRLVSVGTDFLNLIDELLVFSSSNSASSSDRDVCTSQVAEARSKVDGFRTMLTMFGSLDVESNSSDAAKAGAALSEEFMAMQSFGIETGLNISMSCLATF